MIKPNDVCADLCRKVFGLEAEGNFGTSGVRQELDHHKPATTLCSVWVDFALQMLRLDAEGPFRRVGILVDHRKCNSDSEHLALAMENRVAWRVLFLMAPVLRFA